MLTQYLLYLCSGGRVKMKLKLAALPCVCSVLNYLRGAAASFNMEI